MGGGGWALPFKKGNELGELHTDLPLPRMLHRTMEKRVQVKSRSATELRKQNLRMPERQESERQNSRSNPISKPPPILGWLFFPPLADFWMAHVQSETQGTEEKATAGRAKIWAEILAPCCWTGRAWSWSPAKSEAYDKHLRLSTGILEGSHLRSGIGKLFCKGPDSNILGFVG